MSGWDRLPYSEVVPSPMSPTEQRRKRENEEGRRSTRSKQLREAHERQTSAIQTYGIAALCLAPRAEYISLPEPSPRDAARMEFEKWSNGRSRPVHYVWGNRPATTKSSTRNSFSSDSSLPTPPGSPVMSNSSSRSVLSPVSSYPTPFIPAHVPSSPITRPHDYRPHTPVSGSELGSDSESETDRRRARDVRRGKRAAAAPRRSNSRVRFGNHVDCRIYDLYDTERQEKAKTFAEVERRAMENARVMGLKYASGSTSRHR